MKPFKLITALTIFLFQTTLLVANYQSIYIPDQVKQDFSKNKYSKYQVETIPTISLAELKSKSVYNANASLTKHISGTPNFNAIVAADVCKVDNNVAYSSTIYETDLANGVITCMYAVKDDLYNPIGLYKVIIPEVKAYYAINTDTAKAEKASEIAAAEAQFTPLLQKKKEIIAQMDEQTNAGFLTIPELLMAAVLTDNEIIDIEATKATGKFQLKSGYTSKFTESAAVVDNSEYLLADAATIFDVYTGLSGVSMVYLMILVVGFGSYGFVRLVGGKFANKIDKQNGSGDTPYLAGIAAGVLLFFPVNQGGMGAAAGEAGEYELLKTRYQGFEKFGYYTFSDWGKDAAKVVIDAEIDTLIRKSGLGTKEQIVSTWAQKVQSDRLSDFYINNYNLCLNNIYQQDKLVLSDGKGVYSETDKGLFPSSEHWAVAADLGKPMTDGFYETGLRGLLREGAATEGYYPKFAFSSCGKADYLSNYHKDRQGQLEKSYAALVTGSSGSNPKIPAFESLIEFQYKLYRDWGFLAVLGLPVTKMQTEYIGGLYKTGESEVLEKLHKQNGTSGIISGPVHSIMSSIPYMFVPGAKNVFDIVSANSLVIGGAAGAVAGASQVQDGALSGLLGLIGGAAGAAAGSTNAGGAIIGVVFAYQAAKILLAILPIIGLVIVGILRFVIIILKIFAFHFLSLFMMPIMFITKNVEAFGKFTAKILATMLEIPIFVLSVWLAVTANSLIHTIGTVFSKNIVGGMLDNSSALNQLNPNMEVAGFNLGSLFSQMIIYFFDGFMEVVIAVFSMFIIYKIVISLHTMLFETIDLASSSAIDNSIDSMRQESASWGARI